ncbi:hypothetical protein EDB85DRAFT_2207652 [Lactarius pseudohatsudake]|nr:hypothetical protein EDB85DRAFT_2207652 [Lactarius pseudohatsudake]
MQEGENKSGRKSSLSSPREPVLSGLPAPLGTSMTVLVLPNSSLPQRPPRIKTLNSVSSSLEVTSAPTSPATPSVPQPREPLMVYEVMPTLTLHLPLASPSSTPSRSGLAYFNFAFALVSTALVSTLINVSKALSTHSRKLWSKYEDFGNSQIATLNTSSHDVVTQQSRLGQYTPRAARLVFDPGGQPSSVQVSRLPSACEDIRQRKTTTRGGCSTLDTNLPIPVPTDHLIVFDPGGGAFMLEPAHEDSAMLDEDAQ